MKTLYILLLICAAQAGCGAMPPSFENLTKAQSDALARVKDANVSCMIINGPWGKSVVTYANLDKGVVISGVVAVDLDCNTTISNTIPPK